MSFWKSHKGRVKTYSVHFYHKVSGEGWGGGNFVTFMVLSKLKFSWKLLHLLKDFYILLVEKVDDTRGATYSKCF